MSLNTSKTISKVMYNNVEIPLSGSEKKYYIRIVNASPSAGIIVSISNIITKYQIDAGNSYLSEEKYSINDILLNLELYVDYSSVSDSSFVMTNIQILEDDTIEIYCQCA